MSMNTLLKTGVLTIGLGLVAGAGSLNAQGLTTYDGIDYPFEVEIEIIPGFFVTVANSIENDDGGTGWDGPWSFVETIQGKGSPATNTAFIVDSFYNGPVTVSGNAVHLDPSNEDNVNGSTELARKLANPVKDPVNTRTYMSFIGQRLGPAVDPNALPYTDPEQYPNGYPYPNNLYPRGAALRIFNSGMDASGNQGTPGEVLQIGHYSEVYYPTIDENNPATAVDLERYNTWEFVSDEYHETDIPFTDMQFVVMRIDHNGDSTVADSVYLWFNPDLSKPETIADAQIQLPNWTITEMVEGVETQVPKDFSDIMYICPWAGDASGNRPHAEFLFDEFRMGTTWASVTPNEGGGTPTYGIWNILAGDWCDTGTALSWLQVSDGPWVWPLAVGRHVLMPENLISSAGAWMFVPASESGPGGSGELWANYPVDVDGNVHASGLLGNLNVSLGDWVWSYGMNAYIYLPEANVLSNGAWVFVPFF